MCIVKMRCMFDVVVAASSGLDGLIKIWNLTTGQMVKSIDGGPGELFLATTPIRFL